MKILELVMIVKNSGEILRKCLQINKQYIDHWTILDTGSTDNTLKIIQEELKDIPGSLHIGDFIDFSHARNTVLQLSSKTCKYNIMLDDSYILYGGNLLRELLKNSKKACFNIRIGKYIDNYLRNDYYSKRITKTSEKLKYKYRVHEDIIINESKIQYIQNSDIFIDDMYAENHTSRSFERYKSDIPLLLLDYKDYPTDQRVLYYIAKTYQTIEDFDNSLIYYQKIKNLRSSRGDFLFAAHYETICIEYYQDDNIDKFKKKLHINQTMFKDRIEASYKLAVIYRNLEELGKVYEILSKIFGCKKPVTCGTIIESDIYDYYIPYLYIDLNLLLGNIKEAVPVLKKMLEIYPNDQPLLNMKYSICENLTTSSILLSEGKTLVIHTSSKLEGINCWNPNGDNRISGSEYMAMNLAAEFLKIGYRVFIIGTFEDKTCNKNYEGIYNGIEYIDYKYFSEFALKYVIDYLVVSRFPANLVYYENIKNVYLWIHDILPFINNDAKFIQYHKDKFKKVIAVSNWQKLNTIKKLNVPENSIYVSRNAIHPSRFLNKDIDKTPYRFIYTSDPQRGLKYLIQIIPKIKEKYTETTVYLFVNRDLIDIETYNLILNLDYVYLKNRLSQEILALEFLRSDIWLYPTNFPETYCITALEAMMAKCLVVTVKFAGLAEIVEGKGILCKHPIENNLNDLIQKLFFVLERPRLKQHFIIKAYDWALNQTYEKLAQEWVENIFI